MNRAIVCSLLCTLAVSAAAGCDPEPEVVVVQASAVEHGEALFNDPAVAKTSFNDYACSTCHGESADPDGVVLPGAPLAGVTRRPSYWGGQEVDLLRAVNHCLYYFMLKDAPYTADDVEARAIYAYLESISGEGTSAEPAPFTVVGPVLDLPAGDAGRGAVVFNQACASCHGAPHTGEGRLVPRAPSLPEQTIMEHPPEEYTPLERRLVFVEKTRHGGFLGYGGQMPPFSIEKLPDSDLADLLSFFGVY